MYTSFVFAFALPSVVNYGFPVFTPSFSFAEGLSVRVFGFVEFKFRIFFQVAK